MTTPEREIGGIPLLYGFPTLPGEMAVWCRWCLAWHHHRSGAPPTVVAHYEAHCYARPTYYDRGYWVEVTTTPWTKVREWARGTPGQARVLASGRVTEAIRQKQLRPEPQPIARPSRRPESPRKPYRYPHRPARWPESYPTFPEEGER
ncbi:hypothetical protein ABT298_07915 [Streptomyces sp. NPDC001034]|uniref:hypothetical protein n=1 Tax=Streptomyces sp. NPDC001034 TaxID=3154375 RepID=UPI0033172443